jgi:hypothetical protein
VFIPVSIAPMFGWFMQFWLQTNAAAVLHISSISGEKKTFFHKTTSKICHISINGSISFVMINISLVVSLNSTG